MKNKVSVMFFDKVLFTFDVKDVVIHSEKSYKVLINDTLFLYVAKSITKTIEKDFNGDKVLQVPYFVLNFQYPKKDKGDQK